MGRKKKLQHFAENITFPHFFQPDYEEMRKGFALKGKWNRVFFENDNPIVLELGCGKGDYTVGLAEKSPERNFIGVDIKGARMWRGAKDSIEKDLKNTTFLRIRIEHLEYCFDRDEVNEIWITFPDPQPRLRMTKKRMTSPRFLKMYINIIKNNGLLHLKTDNSGFFDFTRELLPHFGFQIEFETKNLYASSWDGEATDIITFYEEKFLEEGRIIKYLKARLTK